MDGVDSHNCSVRSGAGTQVPDGKQLQGRSSNKVFSRLVGENAPSAGEMSLQPRVTTAKTTSEKKPGCKDGKGNRRTAADLLDAQMAALEKMMEEQQKAPVPAAPVMPPARTRAGGSERSPHHSRDSVRPTITVAAPPPPAPAPASAQDLAVPQRSAAQKPDAALPANPVLASLQRHLRDHAAAAAAGAEAADGYSVHATEASYQSLESMLKQLDEPSFQELGSSASAASSSTGNSHDQLSALIRRTSPMDPEQLIPSAQVSGEPQPHFASRPAKWRQPAPRGSKGAGRHGLSGSAHCNLDCEEEEEEEEEKDGRAFVKSNSPHLAGQAVSLASNLCPKGGREAMAEINSPNFLGRRLSLDSVALMSSPSIPSSHNSQRYEPLSPSKLGIEQTLGLIVKLLEEQTYDRDMLYARLKSMDEKLSTLVPEKAPAVRRKMSMVSKKETNAKLEKPDTPRNSRNAAEFRADFDSIDQKLGIRVMKAAKRRADQGGPSWHRSQSIGVIGHTAQDPEKPGSSPQSPRVARAFSRTSKATKDQRGSKELRESNSRDLKDSKSSGDYRDKGSDSDRPNRSSKKGSPFEMPDLMLPVAKPQSPMELKPSGICPVLPSATEEEPPPLMPKAGGGAHTLSTQSAMQALSAPSGEKRKTQSRSPEPLGLNSSGEASLSHLFHHRETAIMKPPSPRLGPADRDSHDENSLETDTEPTQVLPKPVTTSLPLRIWLCICDFGLRITGLLPLVQCRQVSEEVTTTTTTVEEQEPNAALLSKVYNSLLLSLLFLFLILAGPGQFFCNGELLQGDLCSTSSTATDLGVALGAWLAVWSCGGMYTYFKSARMQLQMNELLALEVESSGFEHIWMMQRGRDSLLVFLLWICALSSRVALSLRWSGDSFAALKLSLYAIASGCILSACYLQVSMWRGISLAIVAYARTVLEGNVSCREARAKWREVISCMRQISRMYQLTAASCGLTTVFVCFGALYDFNQGMALDALPSLVVGLSLPGALYVAASATAHCTRLPSLVSMLDGDEELESEYINLALFLSLSESGFFMWDTRVTLAVLQKFLYFTMAIVGTIGFQLKVLTF
eukprot:s624_g15.t2